jgi:hypothetical protein
MSMFKLFTAPNANAKLAKGSRAQYYNMGLHLAPYTLSGVGNTCPKATAGCISSCLNRAGHGGMTNLITGVNRVQDARIRKTRLFYSDRQAFLLLLVDDINKAIKVSAKKGLTLAVRLNLTSDISWEKFKLDSSGQTLFDMFPNVQFYDYSKVLGRKFQHIPNYHLTFSRAESNDADVLKAIEQGYNVAVVFEKTLPESYMGLKVIDGDSSDLRFLDAPNSIVGLKAKGPAKKDTSGFVVRAA